jgi:hypothetical protein
MMLLSSFRKLKFRKKMFFPTPCHCDSLVLKTKREICVWSSLNAVLPTRNKLGWSFLPHVRVRCRKEFTDLESWSGLTKRQTKYLISLPFVFSEVPFRVEICWKELCLQPRWPLAVGSKNFDALLISSIFSHSAFLLKFSVTANVRATCKLVCCSRCSG